MNVYDFDGTIYRGDCTRDFFLFCLVRKPSLALRLPAVALAFARYKRGRATREQMKACFFGFLPRLPDVDAAVDAFWRGHKRRVKGWYLAQRRADDVVISGSPEFLLRPVCTALCVGTVIGSRVDIKTGRYTGKNCLGAEKVCRFNECFPGLGIEAFYSDSLTDSPMARLAEHAFLVNNDEISRWPPKTGRV